MLSLALLIACNYLLSQPLYLYCKCIAFSLDTFSTFHFQNPMNMYVGVNYIMFDIVLNCPNVCFFFYEMCIYIYIYIYIYISLFDLTYCLIIIF